MWVWVYVGSCISGKVIREGLPESGTQRDGLAGERGGNSDVLMLLRKATGSLWVGLWW